MFDHCTIIIILVLTSWVGILEFVRGLRTQKVKIKSTPVFTLNKMGKTEVYFSLHSSWGECHLCFEHWVGILELFMRPKTEEGWISLYIPIFSPYKMGKTEVYFSFHSSWGECQLCFEHCNLILWIQVMAKTTFVRLLV